MYNGIGLQTARGSGTNGYVQANLANLLLSKKRVAYNSEADIKRAEAEINKQPNKELLEHYRKRHIELKCTDFEMLMENKGFDEAEIQNKVNEYRKLLQSQIASGELDIDAEMDIRDTHVRAKAAIDNCNRMRSALKIKDDFIDGTSFEKLNKSVDLKVDEAEKDDGKRKKKKGDEIKKCGKIPKTESSSSSSSSSSSEQSSSDDSSESSSDIDDSSSNSVGESSENNSSDVSAAKVGKKVKDAVHNRRDLSEKTKEPRSYRHENRRSCNRRNNDNGSGFSDREKRRGRDSQDYHDRSHHRRRYGDDHFDYRRSGRSYPYDDGGRRKWYSRHCDRQNDSESDRRRKHDQDEKRHQCEEEKRSNRRYQYSSDSDTNCKQKHGMADHNDDEGGKQLGRDILDVDEKKRPRSKLIEVVPDTKDIKVEPASSSHSGSISSQKISSIVPPFHDESSRNTRNKTPLAESNIAEIALPEERFADDVKMEIDIQESETKIYRPIEDKEKVKQSSDHERWPCRSSEIYDSLKKKSRHDTAESEDRNRSNSSSNDEFLHHSGSTHSSTTSSNCGAAENILNDNSDKVHSPSYSPEPTSEIRDRSKKSISRERKIHSPGDRQERSESEKSTRKHRSRRKSDDENNYRRHRSRGSFARSSHLSRTEFDHDDSGSNKRRHRDSYDYHKHKRHHTESSESKFHRAESYESRRHGHDRSVSSDRTHKLSGCKSQSNGSLLKRHHKSRSRSPSKRQRSRSRSRSRHRRKHSSESRRSASHRIHKSVSVSSRKRSYSPKNNTMKRSSASKPKKFESPESVKSSESAESTNEEFRMKRRRHDTSSSMDEEDSESHDVKRSDRSSTSSSRSSGSSRSSVKKTGKHSNDFRKKRHHDRLSPLREPIDESD
ncbi:unnamed protein product [Cercopithifilaria johnstoni]|uniref:CWF21 domain-containing protein n=1 Tax=Cercopithifilaria johnstoni TaxID=2874296 RepID=A0A8J2LZH6_9BILA|nr:unnamed protein product [Cercopithifilaria johnstoni]